jgi:hypothetical protein
LSRYRAAVADAAFKTRSRKKRYARGTKRHVLIKIPWDKYTASYAIFMIRCSSDEALLMRPLAIKGAPETAAAAGSVCPKLNISYIYRIRYTKLMLEKL